MSVKAVKKREKNPIVIPLAIILAAMAALFAYTIADYLSMPPSEDMSLEIPIGTVGYSDSKLVKSHLLTIPRPGCGSATLGVDGHSYRVITNDVNGNVIEEHTLPLDLFKSRQIHGHFSDQDTLVLYYITDALYRTTVNLHSTTVIVETIDETTESFLANEDSMILQKDSGITYLDLTEGSSQTLYEGEILSYDGIFEQGKWHLILNVKNDFAYDMLAVTVDDQGIAETTVIYEDIKNNELKNIIEVAVNGSLMTALTLVTDERDDLNYITALQYDLAEHELLSLFEEGFPIHKSRFTITDTSASQVSFILQIPYKGGLNLAEATMTEAGATSVRYLTKTRKYSHLSGMVESDGEEILVFCDEYNDYRQLYTATSHPDTIASTTSLWQVNRSSVLFQTAVAMIMGLFIGVIPFLVVCGGVPVILSLVIIRITPEGDRTGGLSMVLPAVMMVALKLWFTWRAIHATGNFVLRPAFIGEEPLIYIVLTLMAAISYVLTRKYILNSKGDNLVASVPFAVFAGIEGLLYNVTVLMYISLTAVIDKIG